MITIAFFNNKGGVGKTALVSHLAWMYAELGIGTVAVDLDPQSNLSSMFLDDERMNQLWHERNTIAATVDPLITRAGDIAPAHLERIADGLHLIVGDLRLSSFEDLLAENWAKCLTGEIGAFRVISAFHRVMREAVARTGAKIVLIDLGPSLGPLNRAALLSAANIVLPIAPDLFSVQGMENLGPTLVQWRDGWKKRRGELQDVALDLPEGEMRPIGYVLMSFGVRDKRPVQAYQDWVARIPSTYRWSVLKQSPENAPAASMDPFQLAALKHYRSLMPLAMTARKPMFALKTADGARGAHLDAVRACYEDFEKLARRIGERVGIAVPEQSA